MEEVVARLGLHKFAAVVLARRQLTQLHRRYKKHFEDIDSSFDEVTVVDKQQCE